MEQAQYIIERLDAIYNEVSEIKVQTTKTNGRVTALETWKNESSEGKKEWKGIIVGFVSAVLVSAITYWITTKK